MKKIEFDYYDWSEFKGFLNQLSDKDATKLIATIQNIEGNGLIVAQRQLWVIKQENNLYEIRCKRVTNIQRAIYFQIQESQYLITHAFTKKSQKTPESEKIVRNRRSQYFSRRTDNE